MSVPLVKKFLEGKIGESKDFRSALLKVKSPQELGAIFAWKGKKPKSKNRHVSIDKNPTLVSALKDANWVAEAIALGDSVGLKTEVQDGLASYGIGKSIISPPSDIDSSKVSPSILYTPSREDVRAAYRRHCSPDESVDTETLLNWLEEDLEEDLKAAGKSLAPGWRDVVRKLSI